MFEFIAALLFVALVVAPIAVGLTIRQNAKAKLAAQRAREAAKAEWEESGAGHQPPTVPDPRFEVAKGSILVAAGGLLLLVFAVWFFNVALVSGGKVGVAMRGGDTDTFTGLKITTRLTKVSTYDRAIPLDLNIELEQQVGPDGKATLVPTDKTVVLTPKDGSTVFIDARAVLALDEACKDNPARRCLTDKSKDKIAGLAVQFRKGGQGALEQFATAKLRERANIVAASYDTADEMVNQQRPQFLEKFGNDVSAELSSLGLTPTVLVVERVLPSEATQVRLDAIAQERANTNQRVQALETAKKDKEIRETNADAEAAEIRKRADAEAHRIREQGAAYSANPQVAAVDIARAYGEKGNATVITDGQTEVRPIVTTGQGQSAPPAQGG